MGPKECVNEAVIAAEFGDWQEASWLCNWYGSCRANGRYDPQGDDKIYCDRLYHAVLKQVKQVLGH